MLRAGELGESEKEGKEVGDGMSGDFNAMMSTENYVRRARIKDLIMEVCMEALPRAK